MHWLPISTASEVPEARAMFGDADSEWPIRLENVLLWSPEIGQARIGTIYVYPDEVKPQIPGCHGEWGITHWMPALAGPA